ncbi:TPA: DUF1349 domain-containing protein [Candidatus Poribacteria bacterium]|nr:DUF1349 domain-containing protein [Candidatus Poribacteria bacterium]HEX30170.1 DUF1349 domain-containing protein [Candidatus Poribacteria bacterium]
MYVQRQQGYTPRYISTPPPTIPTVPRLVVEVFEHVNFQGRRGWVVAPVRFTGDIGFQDNISSCIVYKGPNFRQSPNYKVIFHEHINFQGRRLILGPGYYPNLHDVAYNFGDRISSISFGPALDTAGPEFGTIPLIVEVFTAPNFQGRRALVLRDIRFTRDIGMQDNISSIRIYKGPNFPPQGAKVILYEHIDFEGAELPIVMRPTDFRKEIPDLSLLPQSFGNLISSIRIEGWTSSSQFNTLVFQDEFDGEQMNPVWRWVDPNGGGSWSARQGYLVMRAEPGQDLWWGPNGRGGDMSAPRLIQRISGDFAIETRIPVTPQLREHGGLLVWKDENAFLRLEKTSGPHAFRGDVRFERHINRIYQLVGRAPGLKRAKQVYLRIERSGNQFTGYASADGVNWMMCGTTNVGMGNPIWVGLHALAPGNIPPTVTRFDYFRIFRRRTEAGTGIYGATMQQPMVAQPTQVAAMSPLQRSQRELQRFQSLRQLM